MNKTLLAMSSITYAMKAKEILNSRGIYCEIERTPKNLGSGCGYSIRVKTDVKKVVEILGRYGISPKDIMSDTASYTEEGENENGEL